MYPTVAAKSGINRLTRLALDLAKFIVWPLWGFPNLLWALLGMTVAGAAIRRGMFATAEEMIWLTEKIGRRFAAAERAMPAVILARRKAPRPSDDFRRYAAGWRARQEVARVLAAERPCEGRSRRPGRAPRLRGNHRRKGSRRGATSATRTSRGDPDDGGDKPSVDGRSPIAGGRR